MNKLFRYYLFSTTLQNATSILYQNLNCEKSYHVLAFCRQDSNSKLGISAFTALTTAIGALVTKFSCGMFPQKQEHNDHVVPVMPGGTIYVTSSILVWKTFNGNPFVWYLCKPASMCCLHKMSEVNA